MRMIKEFTDEFRTLSSKSNKVYVSYHFEKNHFYSKSYNSFWPYSIQLNQIIRYAIFASCHFKQFKSFNGSNQKIVPRNRYKLFLKSTTKILQSSVIFSIFRYSMYIFLSYFQSIIQENIKIYRFGLKMSIYSNVFALYIKLTNTWEEVSFELTFIKILLFIVAKSEVRAGTINQILDGEANSCYSTRITLKCLKYAATAASLPPSFQTFAHYVVHVIRIICINL